MMLDTLPVVVKVELKPGLTRMALDDRIADRRRAAVLTVKAMPGVI
jgi:hypothetical protein